MRTKNIFSWPKEIYLFWVADLILGMELIGSILLVFFRDWGGLSQTQTQTIQSWFTFWVFVLEVPTGVFGDVHGKKRSVIIGYILYFIGTITYSLYPNIYLFLISEFILALGLAFVSGAREAWVYDISKRYGIEKRFRTISLVSSTMHIVGMVLASFIYIFVSNRFTIQEIFRLGAIPSVIALIIYGFFIPSTDTKGNGLKPEYLKTVKEGLKILRGSINLRKLTIYISLLCSTSYFVIWLYQEGLRVLSVPESLFGVYRIILLGGEVFSMFVLARLMRKLNPKLVFILIASLVATGFLMGALLHNTIGILFVLIFAGGLGLQIPTLLSKEINEEIADEQRATVLSFVSMIKRLMLTIFNPFVGMLVDSKGVFVAFAVLGLISLIACAFKPKLSTE